MEDGLQVRGRPKKTICQIIKKDVDLNGLSLDTIRNIT